MEQEILSWLETTYERGQETDFVRKETLWNEFVNVGRVDRKCREDFFARLGRCISQSSLKGITVTRSKGKQNGYGGLRKKQGQSSLQPESECEWLPSAFCEKEKEEETERHSLKTHLLVQDLHAPTSSSPDSKSKQGVSDIKKIVEKDGPSYPHGGYIQIIEESRMENLERRWSDRYQSPGKH